MNERMNERMHYKMETNFLYYFKLSNITILRNGESDHILLIFSLLIFFS